MWFKQAKIMQITTPITYNAVSLAAQLEPLAFIPCPPNFPSSYGWTSPIEDETTFVRSLNDCLLICLQLEEKLLPAFVVRQELQERVKHIESRRENKVSQKEKYALKDDIVRSLLPRAFSKLTKVYAYIDIKHQWLVIDNTNTAKVDILLDLLKKSLPDIRLQPAVVTKPTEILTRWVMQQGYPSTMLIEKSCVLTDPNRQSRMIRCQEQDLFAKSVQSLMRDNFEVKQLALSWQDRVQFVLAEDFSLRSIKFSDAVIAATDEMEAETKQQQIDADFLIMTSVLSGLFTELFELFAGQPANTKPVEMVA